VGTTGPIGSGLPQFGLPRRFAMYDLPSAIESDVPENPEARIDLLGKSQNFTIISIFSMEIKRKMPNCESVPQN
jgi:hypothetical protein